MPDISAGGGAWIGNAVTSPFAVPLSAHEPVRRLPGAALQPAGYVAADGVKVDVALDTEETKSWSGLSMSTVTSPEGVSLSVTFMELGNSAVMRLTHPDGSVKELFDSSRVRVEERLDGALPYRSLNFDLFSAEGQRTRLFVPRAVVTDIDSLNFNRSELASAAVHLTAAPDSNGVCLYRLVDRPAQEPTPLEQRTPNYAFVGQLREWVDYMTGDGRLFNLGSIRASLSTTINILSRVSVRSLMDTIDDLINRVQHMIADMTDSELLRIIADWAPRDLISGANLDNFRAAFDNAMSWLRRRTKSIAHAVKKLATWWTSFGVGGLIAGLTNGDFWRAVADFVSQFGNIWQEWINAIMSGDVDHLIDNAIAAINFPALGDMVAGFLESIGLGQFAGPVRAWAGWLGQSASEWGTIVGDALRDFLNRQNINDINEWLRDAMRRWNDVAADFMKRVTSGEILADISQAFSDFYRAAQTMWDTVASIIRENWGVFNPANLAQAWNAFVSAFSPTRYGDIANRFLTDLTNPAALINDANLLWAAVSEDFIRGAVAALDALNLGDILPQLTAAWDQFLKGAQTAIAHLTVQDWVLIGAIVVIPAAVMMGGAALTLLLMMLGLPMLAVPAGLSTLGFMVAAGIAVLGFLGFNLSGALLPWAIDLIVIALLTGHPLAALLIFWTVLNGAKFFVMDFPLLAIAAAAPVTLKAIGTLLATLWVISHFSGLIIFIIFLAKKLKKIKRMLWPLRLTGIERALVAVAIAISTLIIVAIFSATVLGLIGLLVLRSMTLTGRSALLNLFRAIAVGGVALPIVGIVLLVALLRRGRFRLLWTPPVATAVVIAVPIILGFLLHRAVTRSLTAAEVASLAAVLVPLRNFLLAVGGLMLTTVGALIPTLAAGGITLVVGAIAIPASLIFYAASVVWVLSNVTFFAVFRKAFRPLVLVVAGVMIVTLLVSAIGLFAASPLLAPPLALIAVTIAIALGVAGAVTVAFLAGRLPMLVLGLRAGEQALLRLIIASTMIAGLLFAATGLAAGLLPFVAAVVLRGVAVVRAISSVGFVPVFAHVFRRLAPMRWLADWGLMAANGVFIIVSLLSLPLLFLPFRGLLYRLFVPLTLLNANLLFNGVLDSFYGITLVPLIITIGIAVWWFAAWLIAGSVFTPASAPQWGVFLFFAGLQLVQTVILVGKLLIGGPTRIPRRIIELLAVPWHFLSAFGVDTVSAIGGIIRRIVLWLHKFAGVLATPLRAVILGFGAAGIIAAARYSGWRLAVAAANLLIPVFDAFGIGRRLVIAVIITLVWVGIRISKMPKFVISAAIAGLFGAGFGLVVLLGARRIARNTAAFAVAVPWFKAKKLMQLGIGLIVAAALVLFVGLPLTLVVARLSRPLRILTTVAFIGTIFSFIAAALTIVPGVGGAIVAAIAAVTFVGTLLSHPRVLLAPLAGLLALAAGIGTVGAGIMYFAAHPFRAGRRVVAIARVVAVVVAIPTLVWVGLVLAAALIVLAVAGAIGGVRLFDLLAAIAVVVVVLAVLAVVIGSLLLTLFNRVSAVVISGLVVITLLIVAALITLFSLLPLYLRIVNTIAFPLVGIPLDVLRIVTRRSLLGRLARGWINLHLLAIGAISLGLVALVILLNIAGAVLMVGSLAGIAIVVVVVYVAVMVPVVGVVIMAVAAVVVVVGGVALVWWLLNTGLLWQIVPAVLGAIMPLIGWLI